MQVVQPFDRRFADVLCPTNRYAWEAFAASRASLLTAVNIMRRSKKKRIINFFFAFFLLFFFDIIVVVVDVPLLHPRTGYCSDSEQSESTVLFDLKKKQKRIKKLINKK